jgi:flagellar biogenesis protein FliO
MVALVVRMLVSLAVVLALMYVAARLLNRTRGGLRSVPRRRPVRTPAAGGLAIPAARPAELEVVGHRPLGKGASVALVRAGNRTLLIGVTETSVRLLSELEPEADAMPDDAGLAAVTQLVAAGPAPASLLDQLRERTVRRA